MRIQQTSKRSKGFTLMELIIVIAVIALLASLAIPNVSGYLRQGKITKATSDATLLANAINIYNTTLPEPFDNSLLTDASKSAALRAGLIENGLLPKFSATLEIALTNVAYDAETKLFDVKTPVNTNGY